MSKGSHHGSDLRFGLLLVLALLGLPGCSAGAPDDDAESDGSPTSCVYEGQRRKVSLHGCETSIDCPSGTFCTNGACMVDHAIVPSINALTVGFGVRRFGDSTVREGEVLLDPPSGTVFTRCALFRCVPEFGGVENGRRITNFDRCVVAKTKLGSGTPAVILAEMDPHQATSFPTCDVGDRTLDNLAQPRANGVWFGCWAYDEIGIVGATRFIDVRDATDAITLLEPGECEAECTNGRCDVNRSRHVWLQGYGGCVRDDQGGMGACIDGQCRGWCLTDEDCPLKPCEGLVTDPNCRVPGKCEGEEGAEGEIGITGSILGLCAATDDTLSRKPRQ